MVSMIVAFSRLLTGEGAQRADEGRATEITASSVFPVMAQAVPRILQNARALRHAETAAEVRLWEQLRGRRLNGFKFVRQLPIGRFIADFACREFKLAVEVDGATHGSDAEVARDARRTAALEVQGWGVLRVWNEDVFKDLNAVCDAIVLALEERKNE